MKPSLVLAASAVLAAGLVFQSCTRISHETDPSKKEKIDFVTDVKPILEAKCLECHNTGTLLGELNLENNQFASKKTVRGQFIVPGNPQASRLFNVLVNLRAKDDAMPPDGHRMEVEKIDTIHDWILQGAEWPDGPEGTLKPLESPATS